MTIGLVRYAYPSLRLNEPYIARALRAFVVAMMSCVIKMLHRKCRVIKALMLLIGYEIPM